MESSLFRWKWFFRAIIIGSALGAAVVIITKLTRQSSRHFISVQADSIPTARHVIPATLQFRFLCGWFAGIVAFFSFLYSGYLFRWEKGQLFRVPDLALNWLAVGAVGLFAALCMLNPHSPTFSPARNLLKLYTIRWKWLGLGMASLGVLAEANANLLLKGFRLSQHLQMFLFVAGLFAVAYGAGNLQLNKAHHLLRRPNLPLLFITFVALVVRVIMLSDAVHIMIDELHFFDGVNHLRQASDAPILHPMKSIASFPHVFAYLQSWAVTLFGTDFAGMRIPSAIIGTLTVPALYLLANALFDRKTAIISAALLAVFPPHVHFSRLALNNIADPLFGTLALAFLVRGLQKNSQSDYVLAGINLGLTGYFYEGGRLLFLGLFVSWLGIVLLIYRPKEHRRGLLLMTLTAALVMLPYYYTLMRPDFLFTARFTSEAIRPRYLLQDLQTKSVVDVLVGHYEDALKFTFFHTIYSPDDSQFYYGGYTGILPWYIVPFYFLGLFYLLWKPRITALLLWLWLGLSMIGISFVVSTDWTVRFVMMFPAMMLAVAVGIRYPLEFLWPSRIPRRYLYALMSAIIALVAGAQLTHYFGDHLTYYNQQIRQDTVDFYDVFDRAATYAREGNLYYLSDEIIFRPVLDSMQVFQNLNLEYKIWRRCEVTAANLEALPRDRPLLFAVVPTDSAMIRLLHEVFELEGPLWSRYESVPVESQYALYIYKPDTREVGADLSHSPAHVLRGEHLRPKRF